MKKENIDLLLKEMQAEFKMSDECLRAVLFPNWAKSNEDIENHFLDVIEALLEIRDTFSGKEIPLYKLIRRRNTYLNDGYALYILTKRNGPRDIIYNLYQSNPRRDLAC